MGGSELRRTIGPTGDVRRGSEIFQPSSCEEDIIHCQIKRMFEQMSAGDRGFKRFCQVRLLGSPRKLESGWLFLKRSTLKAV